VVLRTQQLDDRREDVVGGLVLGAQVLDAGDEPSAIAAKAYNGRGNVQVVDRCRQQAELEQVLGIVDDTEDGQLGVGCDFGKHVRSRALGRAFVGQGGCLRTPNVSLLFEKKILFSPTFAVATVRMASTTATAASSDLPGTCTIFSCSPHTKK